MSEKEENLENLNETQQEETVKVNQEEPVTQELDEQEQSTKEDSKDCEQEKAICEETATEEKKGFFKKKDKKDKKDEKIEELTDQVKRQMAEFDNFRKRTDKEKTQMFETGAKSIIEKVLPVIDNFERGLAAVPQEEKENAFVQGMDKVYKQMLTELEAAGVKAIEAVGTEFNPELHNAVMQVESAEYETGMVAQELQKGYTYRDGVVRHSMVAVVQ